jgi:hypothetical protein
MDTELRVTNQSLELQQAEIPQSLMQPVAIIEPFDERKDLPALIPLVVDQFIPQGTEEALRHRIIVAIPFAATC